MGCVNARKCSIFIAIIELVGVTSLLFYSQFYQNEDGWSTVYDEMTPDAEANNDGWSTYYEYVGTALQVLASSLLLYGALKGISCPLIYWLGHTLFCLVVLTWHMVAMLNDEWEEYMKMYLTVLAVTMGLQVMAWTVVFRHYRQLTNRSMPSKA